jgi:hypothetical protein
LVVDGVGARYLDADTGEVEPAGTMAFAGIGPGVVELLSGGRVLVAGGKSQAELFDPETGSFTLAGRLHGAVGGFAVATLADGRILLAGGTDGSGTAVASAQVFDPATGTFSPTGSMSFPRILHTATLLPDGRVLVVGGVSGLQEAPGATAEIYDPSTGLFSPAPPPTRARVNATAVSLDDGRVLILGHWETHQFIAGFNGADSAEIFSLAHYEQPEGCCAENPSEFHLDVGGAFGADSRPQLTVTIPAGALEGASRTWVGNSAGVRETWLPPDCETGCTVNLPLSDALWTYGAWFRIEYEGSVPQVAHGITAVTSARAP